MATTDATLAFEHLSFHRGDRLILEDISLAVNRGETVALLGPSGAGKTTLFKLAMGFLKTSQGKIWIAGTEISEMNEQDLKRVRGNVGIVFQDGALFTSLDVGDNVGYGLAESGLSDAELSERVSRTLASMGLEGFENRMPDELSGGQRQRVAVARAIISEPRVMLYDEPTQGLDPALALGVSHHIARLCREGVASLVVTHQLEYARKYANRIALLVDARIRYDGPVEGLSSLDDPFIRSFFDVLEGESFAPSTNAITLH